MHISLSQRERGKNEIEREREIGIETEREGISWERQKERSNIHKE